MAMLLVAIAVPSRAATHQDPLRPLQWGLDQIHGPAAWKVTKGAGVIVAVLDTGVDFHHPDLRGALLAGKDFSATRNVQDDCGHGTEVTGVIAARQGNGIGVSGIAPEVKILPLKDGTNCGTDLTADVAAIRYAADHHARVINYSAAPIPIAGDAAFDVTFRAQFQAAIDYAWAHGTLVVAGAGNESIPLCSEDTDIQHVICVGAVGKTGTRASYSQGDATGRVDYLVAPGGDDSVTDSNPDIWTTVAGGSQPGPNSGGPSSPSYGQVSGTSFATPFVAGVAALLFARGLSVAQVHDRLLRTATDLGPPGRDAIYGWGEVDAAAALRG